jgi:hypothetical protein
VEKQLNGLIPEFKIGAMSLTMKKIQGDLKAWCLSWKESFSENLHQRAYKELEALTE